MPIEPACMCARCIITCTCIGRDGRAPLCARGSRGDRRAYSSDKSERSVPFHATPLNAAAINLSSSTPIVVFPPPLFVPFALFYLYIIFPPSSPVGVHWSGQYATVTTAEHAGACRLAGLGGTRVLICVRYKTALKSGFLRYKYAFVDLKARRCGRDAIRQRGPQSLPRKRINFAYFSPYTSLAVTRPGSLSVWSLRSFLGVSIPRIWIAYARVDLQL